MSESQQGAGPQAAADFVSGLAGRIIDNVEKVVIGKRQAVQSVVTALLSEGHVLMEDVPGVAKTVLAKSVARSIGGTFHRVQCTPDLLPSDITGSSVYNQGGGRFDFIPGPAFANILLADELNRATPRTQSALLECMAEGQITVDGATRELPRPFAVFATQNPIEYEGTFPLPEAQLDRFCVRISVGYPDESAEVAMLERLRLSHPVDDVAAAASLEEVSHAQGLVRTIFVHDEVLRYIVRLVRATRGHADLEYGAGPRATLALFRMAQAAAAIQGMPYVVPDHVKAVARVVIDHRLVLKPEARLKRMAPGEVTANLLARIPAPTPKSAA